MWRVTLDKRLTGSIKILLLLAIIAPLLFIGWDKFLSQESETNTTGIIAVQPQNLSCTTECCDSGPIIKFCQGNYKCINNQCIKTDCPFECCMEGSDFERKDCNKGFACINNKCRYAKELCGNGECDPDHLECVYCQDECTYTLPDSNSAPSHYYYNHTGTCRPFVTPETYKWFINPDEKMVEVIVDNNILNIPGHMWSYFDLAQQWAITNIKDDVAELPYPTPTETLEKRKGTDRERAFLMTSMFLDIVQKVGLYEYENESDMKYEIKTIAFPTKKSEHYFVVVNFGTYQTIYDTNAYNNTMAYSNQDITDVWSKLFQKYGVISQQATKQLSYNYFIYEKPGNGGQYVLPYITTGKTVEIALTQKRNVSQETFS